MTNRPERRPRRERSAATLRSFLSFHSFLSRLWPSGRAKFNTGGVHLPVCLREGPSAFQQRPCSLSLSLPPGQFLLEESRLLEAAEMAEKAARLDAGEFDVVFSAAHMLR